MGLAASQARFLCLTARKADCEYKSTALAQDKLNITEKMSQISNEYAQAMNATKLMWCPDGMDGDFGLSYGLLMTPSAANDFNPYLITTPAGAVILNSDYRAAAEAAGIPKSGCSGSQSQRDKFISALSALGIVTPNTAKEITLFDYEPELTTDDDGYSKITFTNPDVEANELGTSWNWDWDKMIGAGMGKEPLVKGGAAATNLYGVILSEEIGQKLVDWSSILTRKPGEVTEATVKEETERLKLVQDTVLSGRIDEAVLLQLGRDASVYLSQNVSKIDASATPLSAETKEYLRLEDLAKYANDYYNVSSDPALNGILVYLDTASGEYKPYTKEDGTNLSKSEAMVMIKNQIKDDYKKYTDAYNLNVSPLSSNIKTLEGSFNILANDLDNSENQATYSVVVNGVINHYKDELKNMTMGDILSQDVVLMVNSSLTKIQKTGNGIDPNDPSTWQEVPVQSASEFASVFSEVCDNLLIKLSTILGYNPNDTTKNNSGLNVDSASSRALKFAYSMTKNMFLKASQVEDTGSRDNDHAMTENTAYLNANTYNRLGGLKDGGNYKYMALDVSHMMEVFLTYYANSLEGVNSPYVVGKSMETSTLVTDNSDYKYILADTSKDEDGEALSMRTKDADFFDQLYNNIIEHGWRYDASIDDTEYLETVIKNGRYAMSSLNQDGYYYQTRYNETGYMQEVSDTDAIARAEAEFKAMKAELTFKEDEVDLKTKKLDAEIASIAAEVDSVKNIITKSIEKTFTMFST